MVNMEQWFAHEYMNGINQVTGDQNLWLNDLEIYIKDGQGLNSSDYRIIDDDKDKQIKLYSHPRYY